MLYIEYLPKYNYDVILITKISLSIMINEITFLKKFNACCYGRLNIIWSSVQKARSDRTNIYLKSDLYQFIA